MEYLPPNLILKILEYVPIQNRLKLRTISKQFKEIIDFKIPEQLILYFDDYPKRCRFIKYEKYLTDNNLLIMKDVEFYSTANLLKFKKIKKLKSNLNCEYLISADYFLNLFEELIELHIINFYDFYDFKVNLQLKKLKKLKFNLHLSDQNRLKLDTPSLIELKIADLENVDIIYPDKLLILKIYFFDFDLPELFKFKNLEQLKIKNDNDSLTILNRELFERLINLNKLIIIDDRLKKFYNWDREEENKLSKINNFNSKRENLEITINGVEIDQLKGLNSDNFFNFWIKSVLNSSKIHKIKLECMINYNEFMNLFNYELPTNFHTKITKISIICIDGKIEDESKLINLIKRSNSDNLYFCTELSKSFYRQLNISLNKVFFFDESNLNFSDKETNDFLFNPKIKKLYIYKRLSSDFIHLIDYLSNYNLENYSNRSIEFIETNLYNKIIDFHICDNYVSIKIYDFQHLLFPIDEYRSQIKLNKVEFFHILNLIRKSLVECDFLKLKFLIDRINLINSSYTIMIKKLFRTYHISEQIFKSNSI